MTRRPALVCPYCRCQTARMGKKGYAADQGLPERDARDLGLWRTRTIGVCDHCDETWGVASDGVATPCPACGSMHSERFGYGVQRNCWDCGAVWKSPPPAKPQSRFARLMDAVGVTVLVGVAAVFLFWGVLILGAVLVALYVAPIFLMPLGMFALVVAIFYFTSRPTNVGKRPDEFAWLEGLPVDGEPASSDPESEKAGDRAASADDRAE